MILETLVVGAMTVNCYVLAAGRGAEAAVIDPGDGAGRILEVLQRHGLRLRYILLTHAHFDHFGAARELQERTGAVVMFSARDEGLLKGADGQAAFFGMPSVPVPERYEFLKGGDVLPLGGLSLRVVDTPGHSPGGVSYYIPEEGVVFTGDTLFWGAVGRTDLPGSDHGALMASLKEALGSLPDDTKVYPGHFDDTTIGFEKEQNPFFE